MGTCAWSVYALSDPRTQMARYVGKSIDPRIRLQQHLRDYKNTRKSRWIQALKREGLLPQMVVLETGTGDWEEVETKWIQHFMRLGCDLTNATSGGEGLHSPSPETCAKISAVQRAIWDDPLRAAERRIMYETPEWRAAVSAGNRGKPKSAEHIAKLPQNNKGWKTSSERAEQLRIILREKAVPASAMAPRTEKQMNNIQKAIQRNIGKPGWAKGRILTESEREVRSVALKGRPKSAETRERMRQGALRRWARVREQGVINND